MSLKLTDAFIRALEKPESGQRRYYDSEVKGFGCRITPAGSVAFILNYRTRSGRERRYTIGRFPNWNVAAARQEARQLKRAIDRGEDPMAAIESDRHAKTMADLLERFVEEHLPRLRPKTREAYRSIIINEIVPRLGRLKVVEVAFADIEDLHRRITTRGAPYAANRTMAVMSKMFSLAMRWGWRPDNPVRGIEKNPEVKRQRFLSPAELLQLSEALSNQKDRQGADIIRILMLTGARKSEVLRMRFDQLDLSARIWTKPGATTKQKTEHRVPLSPPACKILSERLKAAGDPDGFVFPGRGKPHRTDIKKTWRIVCVEAGLVREETGPDKNGKKRTLLKPTARIHDLRHTYASILASSNLSLPIIGALLGHTQPATTARYAHLLDDPLRAATETAASVIMPSSGLAEVHPIRRGLK